ncbi:S41 family peptidase [Cohnella caldifontis]|uniref:S41 family peptidase n=1 Tax=Cohnella caldifontis TaxID=3027471 RepID=UPI0023EB75BA|nr:S41 family peptidase [Cohnella sp. YIM B05605]
MKPLNVIAKRLLTALLAAFVLIGVWPAAPAGAETKEQVDEVREILEQLHLSKPDDSDLNQTAIDAMVESLHDPYTEYFDPEEWKSFSDSLEQHFSGVGIVLVQDAGTIYAEDVIPGSPAEKAGVKPDDVIVSAAGAPAKGLTIADLQQKLRGKEGTSVQLGVERGGKTLSFTLVRSSIQLPVAEGHLLGDGVGYLSLSGFTSDAGSLFEEELGKLEKSGMTSLVIDLRDNGGGYVSAAQQIASLFIQDGVLAHLKDRDGNDTPIEAKGGGKDYPVTVLVNGSTASASELLSGALQDYGIAKLTGTKTFGKGVVQSIIQLESGGVIKVTVQEYFTPNGRKVDKTGLTPDHAVNGTEEQLIAAFQDAGGRALTVEFGKSSVLINGIRTAHPGAAVQNGNGWSVHLRLAAALVGAQIGYDAKAKTVTVSRGGVVHKLSEGDARLTKKNGWNLIDLQTFAGWFPELKSDAAGGTLKLSVR